MINGLIEKKISIVSNKSQTTRTRIDCFVKVGFEQFVFKDTPGLVFAKDLLGKKMNRSIIEGMADVDVVLFVVEPKKRISKEEEKLIKILKQQSLPVILVVNKIDLVKIKSELIGVIEFFKDVFNFAAIVFVSARLRKGFKDLIDEIRNFETESKEIDFKNSRTNKS